MFYTASEQYSYDLVYTVAQAHFATDQDDLQLGDFQRAYRAWRAQNQPHIPTHDRATPRFCKDAETEVTLLEAIAVTSPLDDLPHYRRPKAFMQVATDRPRIEAEAAHAEQQYRSSRRRIRRSGGCSISTSSTSPASTRSSRRAAPSPPRWA